MPYHKAPMGMIKCKICGQHHTGRICTNFTRAKSQPSGKQKSPTLPPPKAKKK